MAQRKPPERTCVGCRSVRAKRELVRVVRDPQGNVHLDRTGRMAGRGAYVCPNLDCLERALKERRIERALGVTLSEDVQASLRALIASP